MAYFDLRQSNYVDSWRPGLVCVEGESYFYNRNVYVCTVNHTAGLSFDVTRFAEVSLGNLQMAYVGRLKILTGVGRELVPVAGTYRRLRGRRIQPGNSGTTTVQLELNGSPVVGVTLSWLSSAPASTLVQTDLSLAVNEGDLVSFRFTSVEVSAYSLYLELH